MLWPRVGGLGKGRMVRTQPPTQFQAGTQMSLKRISAQRLLCIAQIYVNKGSMATARKQSLRAGMGRASARRCRACAHDGHVRALRTHAMKCARTQKALLTSTLSTSMQQAIFEHESSTGVWKWANLVSPRCVKLHLPWKHVKRLAILSAKNCFRLAPCSLQPTGCARGERSSPALSGWRRC